MITKKQIDKLLDLHEKSITRHDMDQKSENDYINYYNLIINFLKYDP